MKPRTLEQDHKNLSEKKKPERGNQIAYQNRNLGYAIPSEIHEPDIRWMGMRLIPLSAERANDDHFVFFEFGFPN
jgi:hypothetical protein